MTSIKQWRKNRFKELKKASEKKAMIELDRMREYEKKELLNYNILVGGCVIILFLFGFLFGNFTGSPRFLPDLQSVDNNTFENNTFNLHFHLHMANGTIQDFQTTIEELQNRGKLFSENSKGEKLDG